MKRPKSGMKHIDFKVPEKYLNALDDLVKDGYYPNRSEAIRIAIMDMLKKHGSFKFEKKYEDR